MHRLIQLLIQQNLPNLHPMARELILTGIELASYQYGLGDLIAALAEAAPEMRLLIRYEDIDTYLDRLSSNKKIARINVIKDKTDTKGKRFFTVTEMRNE